MEKNIREILRRDYSYLVEKYGEDRVVGVFLYGSQNYGTDTDDSDVDAKGIVIPSFSQLVSKEDITYTHEFEDGNDNSLDVKDIRLMFEQFAKCNINFVEILFTQYSIINPMYKDLWVLIKEKREDIAKYDLKRTLYATAGIINNKYKLLNNPDTMYKGYSEVLRLYQFMKNLLSGWSYEGSLVSTEHELYRDIKLKPVGLKSEEMLIEAEKIRKLAKTLPEKIITDEGKRSEVLHYIFEAPEMFVRRYLVKII